MSKSEMSITEIAHTLEGTEANSSAQTKILLDASLLTYRYESGVHGLKKLCATRVNQVVIDL
ncbi:MAG: hypothetical protein ACXADD_19855 [Candidatus Thorarchaeota archaeon]